jgi:hypothetical protein
VNLYGSPELDIVSSDEVYTPPAFFERLRLEFDLDVCAPAGGLPWIPAKGHYSIADDGLVSAWKGRVWCNPPYSNATPWIRKFIGHGNGVIVVPMVRSRAFHELWGAADALTVPSAFNVTGDKCHFLKDGKRRLIGFAVVVAAFGEECVQAIGRLGVPREHPLRLEAMRERMAHLEYDHAAECGWDGRLEP